MKFAGEHRSSPSVLRVVAVVQAHRVVQEREEEDDLGVGALEPTP